MPTTVDVVVIGAGFAGIGMATRLARRGDTSFVVLERADTIGGTWRDNTYPNVSCDIPSHLYSYSFAPEPSWSALYAPGAEIQAYLERVVAREQLASRLRLATDVLEAVFVDEKHRWQIRTSRDDYWATTLVVCVGRLSEPRIPAIPGLGSFPGPVFHSARWRHDVALAGARVGIVGSGASAVQIVPHVAEQAAEVVLFQRSAPYVLPRRNHAYPPEHQRALARAPGALARLREELFWRAELGFAARVGVTAALDRLRAEALGHLAAQVADPALRTVLTPHYEIGCKRVLLADDYYPALTQPQVQVLPSPLRRVKGTAAIGDDDVAQEIDILVFATGFHAARPPFARRVRGRGGILLADRWENGMAAYESTAVHGFPNLFVVNGPNASLGHNSAVYMIETQIDYVLAALDHRAHTNSDLLEVTAEAEAASRALMDTLSADTVWTNGGCESWYIDSASRRLTLLWPDFAFAFRERLGRFNPAAYASQDNGLVASSRATVS
ncbi:flavin-containing monooxygenase [Rathayibacter toxicus]|uniref:4-hydroxyacetophenone monooxygenase n=1 Tax=Rathayibacter toxicus TaxID=145458 RepID=A0A0U1PUN7_9MICO|nr:NAD(P)/FAD-dependent oxidoreductase [Rathayibacter toxicus]ALS56863.1 4-hydroxyacetophenone monooxygenase [Rathayibacter toxicus]KKM46295.1 4-hydroxyacetophenone monooxygenase [Rathayibacter toxicus]PPG23266.1 NAD(P)/FAD-dependent oxidoreductase [Rathayibacter toxicus]PPG47849.1 NAD(P)/FAD-dependent oxidoreductase [Rathayibacter toxicus]PPH24992.1 NAD(P)/FAD-dependent oxidoreductase [Rathayibacter toxicus]